MKPADEFQCVACGGRGCDECNDSGVWLVDFCPYDMIDPETRTTLGLIELARKGLWPVAGGSLDQTEWFNDAFRYAAAEMPEVK